MDTEQAGVLGLIWHPCRTQFRLHVNDVIRIGDKLGRVIRVTECSAVVLINRSAREFKTRFDKPVRFQPAPGIVRISVNSEIEILNRKGGKERRQRRTTSGRRIK